MNIMDINCMIGTWPSLHRHFECTDALLEQMDQYRIESCLAYHSMSLWDIKNGNEKMRGIAAGSRDRVKPCFVLDPNIDSGIMPDIDALRMQLSDQKPAAVKLYPNPGIYTLNEFYCGGLLELLDDLAMPLLFDADQMPSYEKLPALARAYPNISFVLLRRPFNESRHIFPLIKKLDNVYFDMSIMVDTGLIEEIVRKHGSEKLLFGSGMPFYTPAGALGLIMYARISEAHRNNILAGNFHRIQEGLRWK